MLSEFSNKHCWERGGDNRIPADQRGHEDEQPERMVREEGDDKGNIDPPSVSIEAFG